LYQGKLANGISILAAAANAAHICMINNDTVTGNTHSAENKPSAPAHGAGRPPWVTIIRPYRGGYGMSREDTEARYRAKGEKKPQKTTKNKPAKNSQQNCLVLSPLSLQSKLYYQLRCRHYKPQGDRWQVRDGKKYQKTTKNRRAQKPQKTIQRETGYNLL